MYLLLALLLYTFALRHSNKSKKIESTEENLNYTDEGGAPLRGSVPEVAVTPARDMHEQDTSTPFASHPDDVINVHKALQAARTKAQLSDPDLQCLHNIAN